MTVSFTARTAKGCLEWEEEQKFMFKLKFKQCVVGLSDRLEYWGQGLWGPGQVSEFCRLCSCLPEELLTSPFLSFIT